MKSWLIRTSNNYIFGPLSKNKIVELYENGSLQPDDEICSGNGFWFYIKEEELIQKYLMGETKQDFNPVSEALDVLTAVDINLVAQDDSLSSNVEETQVIDLNMIENEIDEEVDQEIDQDLVQENEGEEVDLDKKKSRKITPKAGLLNNTVLNVLIFLLIIFALSIVYYRKRILKNILTHISLFSPVYAQTSVPLKKKRLF